MLTSTRRHPHAPLLSITTRCILLACFLILPLSLSSSSSSSSFAHAQPSEPTLEGFLPETPSSAPPSAGSVKDRAHLLQDAGVVPDVIPVAPLNVVKLNWPGSIKAHELGTTLTPTQVQERPRLNFAVHANRFYTIAIVDPDAPSRKEPIYGQWIHWLVVNVPGRDVARGDILVEYIGAAPPEGSGKHRYVVLVYEQTKKMPVDMQMRITRTQGGGRSKWNVERFMAQNDPAGAKLVGVNFFYAEWDAYCQTVYAQMVD